MSTVLAAIDRNDVAQFVDSLFLVFIILVIASVAISWYVNFRGSLPYNTPLRAVTGFIDETTSPFLNEFGFVHADPSMGDGAADYQGDSVYERKALTDTEYAAYLVDFTRRVLGLALSNGLIAMSGALLTQYQGFADVQMGIGMVVWGLASVIIGEALVGVRDLGFVIIGAVMGSVLFRLIVALALRGGLDPNDLKLVTAGFVFVALVLPGLVQRLKRRKTVAVQET